MTSRIGEFVTFAKGKAPRETFVRADVGLLPYLSAEFLRGDLPPLWVRPSASSVRVIEGEPLILWDGSNAGEIFQARAGVLASTMTVVRAKDSDLDSDYLGFVLKYHEARLRGFTAGSGIPHVDKAIVKRLPFRKPDLDEQRAIAVGLRKVMSHIDDVREGLSAVERLRKCLRKDLFSGRLKPDGTWRTHDDFWEHKRLGLVPRNWEVDHLRSVTRKITDGEHISPTFQDTGSLMLSAEDVFDEGVRLNNAKYVKPEDMQRFRRRCDPDKGDILIVSRGASVGRTCRVQIADKFALMGSVILIKPSEAVEGVYVSQYLKTFQAWRELRRLSGTTAQQAIYLAHVKKMLIPFPTDTTEQKELGDRLCSLDLLIQSKRAKIDALQALQQSLMQNLLPGKMHLSSEAIATLTANADNKESGGT